MDAAEAGPSRDRSSDGLEPETADQVAAAVLDVYKRLGKGKGKPLIRSDGKLEHTVLSAVVLRDESGDAPPTVVSLATGVKVTPYTLLSKQGDVLHDSHAEVLARRGFRLWVMRQLTREACQASEDPQGSIIAPNFFQRIDGSRRWRLKPRIQIWWYTSTPPCGNASSALLASDQVTRSQAERLIESVPIGIPLRGRLESSLSYLRTKPGRPDSPPAISHSCSDKLALSTFTGLQGSLLSHWLQPIWADALVVGSETLGKDGQTAEELEAARARVEQALNAPGQRAKGAPAPFQHHHLHVLVTSHRFRDSKPSLEALLRSEGRSAEDTIAASGSLVWVLDTLHEGVFDGKRQGASGKRKAGQPLAPAQRSGLTKLSLFRAFSELCKALEPEQDIGSSSYWDVKRRLRPCTSSILPDSAATTAYRRAKSLLRGESEPLDDPPPPGGGPSENVRRFLARASLPAEERMEVRRQEAASVAEAGQEREMARAPFEGWLVTGRTFEGFDVEGRIDT